MGHDLPDSSTSYLRALEHRTEHHPHLSIHARTRPHLTTTTRTRESRCRFLSLGKIFESQHGVVVPMRVSRSHERRSPLNGQCMMMLIYYVAPQRIKSADATSIARGVNKTNGIDAGAEACSHVRCALFSRPRLRFEGLLARFPAYMGRSV